MSMERWRGRKQAIEGTAGYPFKHGPPFRVRDPIPSKTGVPSWPVEAGVDGGPWNGLSSTNTGPGATADITIAGTAAVADNSFASNNRVTAWIEYTLSGGPRQTAYATASYSDGDDAATVAAALAAAIDALPDLSGGAAGATVTITPASGVVDLVQCLHAH